MRRSLARVVSLCILNHARVGHAPADRRLVRAARDASERDGAAATDLEIALTRDMTRSVGLLLRASFFATRVAQRNCGTRDHDSAG